ncbi:hypothetical protein KIPB_001685 [Kipferlia bialata]|uniref:Uncharacterized protein n=1 Tax=Kipferlia bialata TaxID=797122 RepID=A0A9K3CP17_9EUKA|nr:hypothetical protein KIPB_001685 [Kipferlia bialata]|eukprot:g1685.t1
MRIYVRNQGGGDILSVECVSTASITSSPDSPSLSLHSTVAHLIDMVQRQLAESVRVDVDDETDSEDVAEGREREMDVTTVPLTVTLLDSTHSPLSPHTAIGMLGVTADAMGCVHLTAVVEQPSEGETGEGGRERQRKRPPLADVRRVSNSVEHTTLAHAPNLHLDPGTTVTRGPVVNMLTVSMDAVVAVEGGRVRQVVPIHDVPSSTPSSQSMVSVEGGRYTLLSVSRESKRMTSQVTSLPLKATAYSLRVIEGCARWVECPLDMSDGATSALSQSPRNRGAVDEEEEGREKGGRGVVMGRDSETGGLLVATHVSGTVTHVLSLHTTHSPPQLRVKCAVTNPLPPVGGREGKPYAEELSLSVAGAEAVMSLRSPKKRVAVPSVSTLLTTGSQRVHGVEGYSVTPFPGGSLFLLGGTLHAAVHNSTCMVVARDVARFSVHGDTVLWVDTMGTLSSACTAQLRRVRHLVAWDPTTDTLPPHTSPNWAKGFPVSPLSQSDGVPLSCHLVQCHVSSTSLLHVALSDSVSGTVSIQGLYVLDCVTGKCEERVTFVPQSPSVDTYAVPAPFTTGVFVGGMVYGCVRGSLFCIDISRASVADTSVSCIDTPRVARGEKCLILSTPTGQKQYPLPECDRVGVLPLVSTDVGSMVGECSSGACLDGVAETETGYYKVQECMWHPMGVVTDTPSVAVTEQRGRERAERTPQCVTVESREHLESVLRAGGAERIVVKGLRLDDALAGSTCHQWSFERCHFSSLARARFSECSFQDCSFETSDLSACSLCKTTLKGCTLEHALLTHASLVDAQLEGCSLSRANMSHVTMVNVSLKETPLMGTNLDHSTLSGLNMKGWDLSGASLIEAVLRGSTLAECNLSGACLKGCDLTGCLGLSEQQIRAVQPDLQGIKLTGLDVAEWDLSGLNLNGSDLSRTDISGCNLTGTTLVGANLSNTRFRYCESTQRPLLPEVIRLGSGMYSSCTNGDTNMGANPDPLCLLTPGKVDVLVDEVMGWDVSQFHPQAGYTQYLLDVMEGIAGLSSITSNVEPVMTRAQNLITLASRHQSLSRPLLSLLVKFITYGEGSTHHMDKCDSLLRVLSVSLKPLVASERRFRDSITDSASGAQAPLPSVETAADERSVANAIYAVCGEDRWYETTGVTKWAQAENDSLLDASMWLLRRSVQDASTTPLCLQSIRDSMMYMSDEDKYVWVNNSGVLDVATTVLDQHAGIPRVLEEVVQLGVRGVFLGRQPSLVPEPKQRSFANALLRAVHAQGSTGTPAIMSTLFVMDDWVVDSYHGIIGTMFVERTCDIIADALNAYDPADNEAARLVSDLVLTETLFISKFFHYGGLPAEIGLRVVKTCMDVSSRFPLENAVIEALVFVGNGRVLEGLVPEPETKVSSAKLMPLLRQCPGFICAVSRLFHGRNETIGKKMGLGHTSMDRMGLSVIVSCFQDLGDAFEDDGHLAVACEAGLLQSVFGMMATAVRPPTFRGDVDVDSGTARGLTELAILAMTHTQGDWRLAMSEAQKKAMMWFLCRSTSRYGEEGVAHQALLIRLCAAYQGEEAPDDDLHRTMADQIVRTFTIMDDEATPEGVRTSLVEGGSIGDDEGTTSLFYKAWQRMAAEGGIVTFDGVTYYH